MKLLDEKEINSLFYDCLFAEEEIINGRPTSDFLSVQLDAPNYKGRCPIICFSVNRLNRNKQTIIDIINCLPKIDDGNTWEALCYDNKNNKWCSEIKSLDQLIMLGKACGLLSHTIMQSTEGDIVIIRRERTNDNLSVKGVSPENLPLKKENELAKPKYTEEELEIIRQNKVRITNDLKRDIEIIKKGLCFFGINVEINIDNQNQLDFFDYQGNLIKNYVIEDTGRCRRY